jgi:hypothetical protein
MLHGVVEALENGKVRISYDFSSADQLLDWQTPDVDSTSLEIEDPYWGQDIVSQHRYGVVVTISESTISWDVDGEIETRQGQFDTNTNRSLFLGGWQSTVLFDNIVFEGELDE